MSCATCMECLTGSCGLQHSDAHAHTHTHTHTLTHTHTHRQTNTHTNIQSHTYMPYTRMCAHTHVLQQRLRRRVCCSQRATRASAIFFRGQQHHASLHQPARFLTCFCTQVEVSYRLSLQGVLSAHEPYNIDLFLQKIHLFLQKSPVI